MFYRLVIFFGILGLNLPGGTARDALCLAFDDLSPVTVAKNHALSQRLLDQLRVSISIDFNITKHNMYYEQVRSLPDDSATPTGEIGSLILFNLEDPNYTFETSSSLWASLLETFDTRYDFHFGTTPLKLHKQKGPVAEVFENSEELPEEERVELLESEEAKMRSAASLTETLQLKFDDVDFNIVSHEVTHLSSLCSATVAAASYVMTPDIDGDEGGGGATAHTDVDENDFYIYGFRPGSLSILFSYFNRSDPAQDLPPSIKDKWASVANSPTRQVEITNKYFPNSSVNFSEPITKLPVDTSTVPVPTTTLSPATTAETTTTTSTTTAAPTSATTTTTTKAAPTSTTTAAPTAGLSQSQADDSEEQGGSEDDQTKGNNWTLIIVILACVIVVAVVLVIVAVVLMRGRAKAKERSTVGTSAETPSMSVVSQ